MDDLPDVGKRLAAARAYAGITSQAKLGELLGGMSQSTIQRIERGERNLKPYEMRTLLKSVADLCELPVEWFTADWQRLGEIVPENAPDLTKPRSPAEIAAAAAQQQADKTQPSPASRARPRRKGQAA